MTIKGQKPPLESVGGSVYPSAMNLALPESMEARLSPEITALHLAIGLFVSEETTLGQAAEIAGLSQSEFLRELGQRRIPIHYGIEELSEDLRTVESLARR
jgi:predicted HTH domain antitoxin